MRNMESLARQMIVPALALAYAAHALWELNDGSYQRVTIIYTAVIAIPMLIMGAIAVAGDLRQALRVPAQGVTDTEAADGMAPGGKRRLVLFIVASFVLVPALDYVGYLAGFFVYVCFVLWALDVRRPLPMLVIAVAMVAIVHFVFAGVLGQDLPQGFMTGWLGE